MPVGKVSCAAIRAHAAAERRAARRRSRRGSGSRAPRARASARSPPRRSAARASRSGRGRAASRARRRARTRGPSCRALPRRGSGRRASCRRLGEAERAELALNVHGNRILIVRVAVREGKRLFLCPSTPSRPRLLPVQSTICIQLVCGLVRFRSTRMRIDRSPARQGAQGCGHRERSGRRRTLFSVMATTSLDVGAVAAKKTLKRIPGRTNAHTYGPYGLGEADGEHVAEPQLG